jgi:hypothetical protein
LAKNEQFVSFFLRKLAQFMFENIASSQWVRPRQSTIKSADDKPRRATRQSSSPSQDAEITLDQIDANASVRGFAARR